MTIFKLALRNLMGAGLKTWLRVVVLSFAFVVIIGLQGLIDGMDQQATHSMISTEIGGGQYWQEKYDPYNPLDLPEAHRTIPAELQQLIDAGNATPILIVQGSLYSRGSSRPVLLKGIDPRQRVLALPSAALAQDGVEPPALIGSRMAKESGLKITDSPMVRWRDAHGTFDAQEVRVVEVMHTMVQSVDSGQLWVPLDTLQKMTRMEGEATLIVLAKNISGPGRINGWEFKDSEFLLADIKAVVKAKTVGSSIAYLMLLFLAMLAILDTQVLSIFNRRKEIGTLMALGLTRGSVIGMFTLEGALNAILAALAGAVYGIPLLAYFTATGMTLPAATDATGISLGEKLYPAYSLGLVAGTTALVFVVTTIVSYLPTRRIARLRPTDALRGRLT